MKILILTSATNPLAAHVALELAREEKFIVHMIFLNYKGSRGWRLKNIQKQIRQNGFDFIGIKLGDIISLWFRNLLRCMGMKLSPVFPVEVVNQENIPLKIIADINTPESISGLKKFAPDILITAGFGQILKQESLSIALQASINLHPGLLPQRPGSNPFRDVLMGGDLNAGVTVHRLTEKVDKGEILEQISYPVPENAGERKLRELATNAGAALLFKVVNRFSI